MRNVFWLGLVSFFTDLSTEMVYPLIPLYLVAAFGATPALIGVIEGVVESLASLLKVLSGYASDRFQQKKALAFAGYSAGLLYKVILLLAGSWFVVALARAVDRFGKGIRTAPRDVLVSESADKGAMGKAFGLHKALDMAGAALGILITYFLLSGGVSDYKNLFLLSMVPAVLGLGMFLFVKEKRGALAQDALAQDALAQDAPSQGSRPARLHLLKDFRTLDGQLKLYLVVVAVFALGNSSNAFLLLKAQAVGFDDVSVILLYFVYSLVAAIFSVPLSGLSDKLGRKKLLVAGYLVFSVVYLGFGLAFSMPFLVAMFVLYGVYTAMIAGVERAFVAEIAPPQLKGTLLGLQSTVVGVALLPASIITGALWSAFGSVAPFIFGALLSLIAAVSLQLLMKNGSASAAS